jgi:Ssl1-like
MQGRTVFLQEAHIARLRNMDASGDASLQNGLDAAVATLRSIPPYGHREVLKGITPCPCDANFLPLPSSKHHVVAPVNSSGFKQTLALRRC